MIEYRQVTSARAELAWALLARPALWSHWAPHLRGAWGLGAPEVRRDAFGAVRLLGVLPVPAKITAKQQGRSWAWKVGPIEIEHRVEDRSQGCEIVFAAHAPAALGERALAATYGRVMELMLGRLAAACEQLEAETRAESSPAPLDVGPGSRRRSGYSM